MAGFSSCSKINLFIEEDKSVIEHILTILLFCHDEQLEFIDPVDFLCLFKIYLPYFLHVALRTARVNRYEYIYVKILLLAWRPSYLALCKQQHSIF